MKNSSTSLREFALRVLLEQTKATFTLEGKRRMRFSMTILSLCLASMVWANDSTARLGTGGIELQKNDQVQMRREVSEMAVDQIKVDYEFVNTSGEDIETLVAFPMPLYGWNPGVSVYDDNIGPISHFKVWSDGIAVKTDAHYRALVNGKDVSDALLRAGLTTEQVFNTFGDCQIDKEAEVHCRIDPEKSVELVKLGIVNVDKSNTTPLWQVEQIMTWTQIFPAAKPVHIVHTYTPLVGRNFSYPVLEGKKSSASWFHPAAVADTSAEACLDESFRKAYTKRVEAFTTAGAKSVVAYLSDVEYILGTGRNWQGPILDFTLRLRKAHKDQLISLCFSGKSTKINATTIEFVHKDFVPQDKLIVYFYELQAR